MITAITYDFYTVNGKPWFCSYCVVVMDNKGHALYSELIQLNDIEDFKRLLKTAQEEGFTKEYDYSNPTTGCVGETYRKCFGID